jgi:hypothetical protein
VDWPGLYGTTGTTISLSDDSVSGNIPFGFSFDHYGITYTHGRVSSNGFMYFGNDGGTSPWYSSIPSTSGFNNVAAFYGYDLYPPGGGAVRYRTEGVVGARTFVLTFEDINQCCSTGTSNVMTGQLVLHEGGGLEILVEDALASGSAEIGVENLTGSEGESFHAGNISTLGAPAAFNFNMNTVACNGGCLDGYYGETCTSTCPGGVANICDGNGTCSSGTAGDGTCACDVGYAGSGCTIECAGGAATPCTNNGTCSAVDGTCACDAGFEGADCATVQAPCADGVWGAACENTCPGGAGAAQCSGNGTCADGRDGTGECSCDAGSAGVDCSTVSSGPGCGALAQEALTWPSAAIDYSGTPVTGLSDDSVSPSIPFGFTSQFFGVATTFTHVSSNGFMYMGAGSNQGCCSGDAIPLNDSNNSLIALTWGDLYPPGNANSVRWRVDGTAPNRQFVVSFENVPDCCTTSPTPTNATTGQMIVHEGSSAVDIYCENCVNDGRTFTIGVEETAGASGIQLHRTTTLVTDTAWRVFTGACP